MVRPDLGGFESPFEEAVAAALGRRGWTIRTQVGVSAFRIDLGVVHPDAPGAFLTGVECDGATYHRSATARDRDKLREQVLRRLGWEILRVWSTDWWIDPIGTLDQLDQALIALLEASRAKRQGQASLSGDPLESGEDSGEVPVDSAFEATSAGEPVSSSAGAEPPPQDSEDENAPVESEAFFNATYDPVLVQMIDQVVAIEGPILDAVLSRRIARMHGWQRTGTRIQTRVENLAGRTHLFTREDHGRFFWPKAIMPEDPFPPRKSWNALERSVEEVCLPELVALAREVLRLGGRDASSVTTMARALGLNRVKSANRERLELALTIAEQDNG
jgi:very-short-patch-repair endonuclease